MRRYAILLLLLLPAACASPEPSYYTLAAQPAATRGAGPRTIQLRRVGLAGYLDRTEIVSGDGGYRLRIANTERWAEPLGDMVGRVLAEDLTGRLPGSAVFSEAGAISADTDATVEVDVQRFDAGPDGTVTLLAQVAVSRGRSNETRLPAVTRSLRLTAPSAPGTAATVGTMSNLLGQLADAIAILLHTT